MDEGSPSNMLLILSILYGLVVVGVLSVLLTVLVRVPVEHSTSLRHIFRSTRFLELTTVLVIIISGTYLAWAGKLNEGIVSLLSGIAGYVLGGLGRSGRSATQSRASGDKPKADEKPKGGA